MHNYQITNNMKMKISVIILTTLLLGIFFIPNKLSAQVTIGSDIDPAKGALLDIKNQDADADDITSVKGGIVIPRVRLIDINTLQPFMDDTEPGIAALKKSHVGLIVYNLSQTGVFIPGLYVWDGTTWIKKEENPYASIDARNGLSLTDNTLELGGNLIKETVINQAGYNMAFTTGNSGTWKVNPNDFVVFGDNSVGIGDNTQPENTQLAVGGNVNMEGRITVTGNSLLENDTEIDGVLKYNYNGTDNSGKYLMAIDNEGTAEWNSPTIGTASTISGTALGGGNISIPHNSTNWYSSNQYISLPYGKWLVKFTFLMRKSSNTNNHQKIWLKLGFSRRTNYSSSSGHEAYDKYRDRSNPSWPVYVECVLDAMFDYTSVTGDVIIDNTATPGDSYPTNGFSNGHSRFDLVVIKEGEGLRPQGNSSWNWTSGDLRLNGGATENMIIAIKLD